jgi:hypothetical protein
MFLIDQAWSLYCQLQNHNKLHLGYPRTQLRGWHDNF